MKRNKSPTFDVVLSFAGPQRAYARAISSILEANGVSVYLDERFKAQMWGTNLVERLHVTYSKEGRYCLILISKEYRQRIYTKVERRAALDRMITEKAEYLLPVKVDDSWIDGLPQSTAYLDLRTEGIIGICEALVEKIGASLPDGRLVIPESVEIPRIPVGMIPAELLEKYLLEHCKRERVAMFGALIYDEQSVELRKLLREQDYWDALDRASGPHFEVFALRDRMEVGFEYDNRIGLMTGAPFDRAESKRYWYSRLLKEYFGVEKTRIPYPTVLLFLVENGSVTHFRNIPLKAGALNETFERLRSLFSIVATTLDAWLGASTGNSDTLWAEVKEALLEKGYTIYMKRRRDASAEKSISELAKFIEKPAEDTTSE
jgi:hypothetical protein